jgi:SpoVK/Ycf46/Vps4 family AAA+-type ATPase
LFSRFDKICLLSWNDSTKYCIPKPDVNRRQKILEIHTEGKDVDLGKVAETIEGFNGVDVAAVANSTVSLVLDEYLANAVLYNYSDMYTLCLRRTATLKIPCLQMRRTSYWLE